MSAHNCFQKHVRNQKGQGLVEYLIIVALVAVATISIMKVVGQSVQVKFAQISKSLGADVEGNLSNAQVTESMYKKKDLKDFFHGSLNNESKK
ncbi:MAG: hypothetical protein BroJett040_22600 [Oligoflexia bacterium]|nr:MAG: hypothetical protein BroJett040_22600 [Oligoflexia bacterium]